MYEVIPYPDNDSALINDLMKDIKESGDQRNYADFKRYVHNLSEFGLEMNSKFKSQSFKKLEESMYELRPKNFRVIFTVKSNVFYLLNGFMKKTNETPKHEKEKARKYINIILKDEQY